MNKITNTEIITTVEPIEQAILLRIEIRDETIEWHRFVEAVEKTDVVVVYRGETYTYTLTDWLSRLGIDESLTTT